MALDYTIIGERLKKARLEKNLTIVSIKPQVTQILLYFLKI